MSKPRILADILKDYFQNSNEPLAVEFRKYFAGTNNPLLSQQPSNDTLLEEWIDSQDVMQALHISPRTLQTLRSNGILPYSRIGNKIYYLQNLLPAARHSQNPFRQLYNVQNSQ